MMAQVVAQPRPLDRERASEGERRHAESDVVVRQLAGVELEVYERLGQQRQVDAAGPADLAPVDEHGLDDLADGDRGDGEIVAAESKAGIADRH